MKPNVLLQYILPHRFLSRIVYWATRWEWTPWMNFLIGEIVQRYNVDMSQAAQPDPLSYVHFNACFTRKLKQATRSSDPDPQPIFCPLDGLITQSGRIR